MLKSGQRLRVCLVDGPFEPYFRSLGHRVLRLAPPTGVHDIAALCAAHDFVPNLLLHTETLGRKVILRGVERLPCPTAYWAVDPHMNCHWQRHYAALFDATFTTQAHFSGHLPPGCGQAAEWLPWFGSARPFRPFGRRGTAVGFVGRLGAGRPVRAHFMALLAERFGARHAQDLSLEDMQSFYDDTRLAPNEALFGEVNFRLFETASSGCLCLTPRAPGLEELFADGTEVVGYETGEDLVERLRHYLDHPDQALTVARAGHAAIAARHLVGHRAQALCAALSRAPGRARGEAADVAFDLTLIGLMELGLFGPLATEVEADLARLAANPEAAGGLLRLWRLAGRKQRLLTLCTALAGSENRDPVLAATASLGVLWAGSLPLARTMARVLARSLGRTARGRQSRPLESPRDICLFAAAMFRGAGRIMRPGLVFDPNRLLPQTEVEALIVAHTLDTSDGGVLVALDAALEPMRGTEETRLGLLSALSLGDADNWRWPLRLALVNSRMFRLDEAAQERALALELARRADREHSYLAMRDRLFPPAPTPP